jgi:uncharacterized protein (TIGR02145 family)
MAENLKTSKFSDGTPISNVVNKESPAWFNYGNDPSSGDVFGKLYNGYTVSSRTNGGKNVCPTGWHVSTDDEWLTLVDYLGGWEVAGDKLKEAGDKHWNIPNTEATNSSLFSALPGGYYNVDNVVFDWMLWSGVWYTSTELTSNSLWTRRMYSDNSQVQRGVSGRVYGFSIRCVKD